MPLSQADFYSYSRATGAPLADTPEKRAEQAPEVYAYRQSQLKAPEQGPSIFDAIGNAALIGATAAGGFFGGRALARAIRNREAAQGVEKAVIRDITPESTANVRRAAAYQAPAPSKVATPAAAEARPNIGIQMVDLQELVQPKTAPVPQPTVAPKALPAARKAPAQGLTDFLAGAGYTKPEIDTGTPYSARELAMMTYDAMEVAPELDVADRLLREYEEGRQYRSVAKTKEAMAGDIIDQLRGESLTAQQQQTALNQVEHNLEAIGSAEDQMTGRVKQQLQRNEDYDLSQIEILEDLAKEDQRLMRQQAQPSQMIGYEANFQPQETFIPGHKDIYDLEEYLPANYSPDGPINRIASQLPDGLPIDQAEQTARTSAQNYLTRAREEIASQLGEQGLPMSPSRIEAELANRFGSKAYEYGPKQTRRRQALELYAQTGDPRLLENIRQETVKVGQMGEVPVTELKKPVAIPEVVERSEQQYQEKIGKAQDWLGNFRLQLEPKRNQILQERRQLVEQSAAELKPQLEAAQAKGQVGLVRQLEAQLNTLRTVWRNPEIGMHRKEEYDQLTRQIEGARQSINKAISGIERRVPTTLKEWSGEPLVAMPVAGQEEPILGYAKRQTVGNLELDPVTGERMMQTLQGRSIRGIGGRPGREEGMGAGLGIYGIEAQGWGSSAMERGAGEMEYTEAAMRRPTKTAPSRTPLTQEPTETRRASVDLSRTIQNIYASGRPTAQQEVKELVESLKAQQNLSAVGEALPVAKGTPSMRPTSALSAATRRPATPGEQALARYIRSVGNPFNI